MRSRHHLGRTQTKSNTRNMFIYYSYDCRRRSVFVFMCHCMHCTVERKTFIHCRLSTLFGAQIIFQTPSCAMYAHRLMLSCTNFPLFVQHVKIFEVGRCWAQKAYFFFDTVINGSHGSVQLPCESWCSNCIFLFSKIFFKSNHLFCPLRQIASSRIAPFKARIKA